MLTGAFGLGKGILTGRYLLNLDSEDEAKFSSAAPAASIRWLRSVIRRRPHLKATSFSGFGYPTFRADTPATISIGPYEFQ